MAATIRVLVVDDSIFMRSMLKDALARAEGMEVVGSAQNGTEAVNMILALRPDVVTLDVEMPGLSGIEVLERVMKTAPTPIVMVSTRTQQGAKTTVEALSRGAIECVAKPLSASTGAPGTTGTTLQAFREKVVCAVRAAASCTRSNLGGRLGRAPVDMVLPRRLAEHAVVAIGISAGGPQTLHQMLPAIPPSFPPIVITQHMPAGFTAPFADRLNSVCKCTVTEAAAGDVLEAGHIYIAPGHAHLRIVARLGRLAIRLSEGAKVSGFRPSVDAMFDSLATAAAARTVAVMMTGMGSDGAAGLKRLKQGGAQTISQDQQTSIVYGMPKAAAATGCVDQIVPMHEIPRAIATALQRMSASSCPVG